MGNESKKPERLQGFITGSICICILAICSACGSLSSSSQLELPSAYEVPSEERLPIDGTWELQFQSTSGAIFKIEGRRMYVYANYGPRAWHGMIIAKNIRQINPIIYGCEYAFVDRGKTTFCRGKIEVASEESLLVHFFPKSTTGHEESRTDLYKKMLLENEAWFLSELSHGKK